MIYTIKLALFFFIFLLIHFLLVFILLSLDISPLLFTIINLSSTIIFVFLYLLYAFKKIGQFIFMLLIIFGLISYNVISFSLLNTDRSRSFFVLSWVKNGDIGLINQNLIVNNPVSLEFQNSDSVIQRIEEQRKNGLIDSRTLKLTTWGKYFLSSIEFVARVFSLKGWYENT